MNIEIRRNKTLVDALTLLEFDVWSAALVRIEIGTDDSPATSTCVVGTTVSGAGLLPFFFEAALPTSSWLNTSGS